MQLALRIITKYLQLRSLAISSCPTSLQAKRSLIMMCVSWAFCLPETVSTFFFTSLESCSLVLSLVPIFSKKPCRTTPNKSLRYVLNKCFGNRMRLMQKISGLSSSAAGGGAGHELEHDLLGFRMDHDQPLERRISPSK